MGKEYVKHNFNHMWGINNRKLCKLGIYVSKQNLVMHQILPGACNLAEKTGYKHLNVAMKQD